MTDNELLAILALQKVPKIGDATAKRLIAHCGSASSVFTHKKVQLAKLNGVGQTMLKDLHLKSHFEAAEEELRFIRDYKIAYSYFTDNDYPQGLKHCIDGPILLFQSGNIDLKNKRIISIVGTRQATNYGMHFCQDLIEELAPLNPVIVSGFAYGVDIIAHRAALEHKLQTIGCLAHGLNQIYPKVHKKYVADIESNGGFVTDFWSSDGFDRNNFLKRNRIIAGLSEATIVIESAEKGGSLVTADIANSYDREVFAVPGRTTDKFSKGCNNLIKHQRAHILTSAADLIYMLGWELKSNKPLPIQKKLFVELNNEEKAIFRIVKDKGKVLLDHIALETELPPNVVASNLLSMELKGIVRPLPGKQFELV
ncbi:DNA-processing protein DprA [Sungkyunkwania multivorans]|uniref:DNA-processing protein DprA n=1 Tax=Sungkyunkwania multivorans TaxID=1173618 RepID=A0ABW3D1R7_9FLAO